MRDAPDVYDMRLLEPAIQRRQAAMVAALLDASIDPEGRDAYGRTALIGYCLYPDVDLALVELLIARGANIHARDAEGRTALHAVAWNHNYPQGLGEVIRLLVGASVSVDARDNQGRTALHLAVEKEFGDRKVVDVLLDLGADIDARDADGLTPLILAADVANLGHLLVRLLLAHGADPGARRCYDVYSRRGEARINATDGRGGQCAWLGRDRARPAHMRHPPV